MKRIAQKIITTVLGISLSTNLLAASLASEPLLNKPVRVASNFLLVLDTSGSMDAEFIYEYGGTPDGYGYPGPTVQTYARYSPNVNRIYYDPRVTYLPRVDYLGTPLALPTPSTTWKIYFRKATGPYTAADMASASDFYSPYTPPASEVVAGSVATYPTSVNYSKGAKLPATFPKFINRTDCKTLATACTKAEEQQNHANWKAWYSTRGLMATTSLGAVFQPLENDVIRLGYGTIGNLSPTAGKLAQGVASMNDSPGGVKEKFYNWMYSQAFNTSTPNLPAMNNAGKYFQRTDSDGPWGTTPDPDSIGIVSPGTPKSKEPITDHASCRRSFSMLVTDGYSNGSSAISGKIGNIDGSTFTTKIDGVTSYNYPTDNPNSRITKDKYSDTMADIAMKYWGTDLRADIPNKVLPINSNGINNPSRWQNVTFYAVTLGIDGSKPRTQAFLDSIGFGDNWPKPVDDKPSSIDDLWHATINSNGELLNARNTTELTSGIKKMFQTIAGTPQTLSGVATSSLVLVSTTQKFVPKYTPGTWGGNLSSIKLDPKTGNDIDTNWVIEKGVDSNGDPISLIEPYNLRNVYTWSSASSGVVFNDTNTGLSSDLVNYLKGDFSKELRKSGGIYRSRESKLGDIINSTPVYIQGNLDLDYQTLNLGDYRAFVGDMAKRTDGALFVGANDGMLHGFNTTTGKELFAYIPQAVIPKLKALSESPYTHQYYVDGPNTETHAYLDSTWKDLVLGTTGAGAKAVYAIDVTDPQSMKASNILWEISSASYGFGNLGHVLSDVQAGKVEATGAPNDDWVAVFGNGFDSSTGVASLFVVNLKTGALIKELVADSSGGNGLGGVHLVRDATQRVIGAYAGDLKGNLWKFDLTGPSSSTWKVDLDGAPLYAAGATQPITAAPVAISHPSGGYVVSFGTGKLLDNSDILPANYKTQRLYGIWDRQTFGAASIPTGASFSGLGLLQEQVISAANTASYFKLTSNAVGWGDGLTSGQRGWYIDLPNSGQRLIYPISRVLAKQGSTFIFANTMSPESPGSAADLCVGSGAGSAWVYLLNGLTGAGPSKPPYDTNGDGYIDDKDEVVSGYTGIVDGRLTTVETGTSGKECDDILNLNSGTSATKATLCCLDRGTQCNPPSPAGVLIKKREWRQIFMR